MANSHRPEAIVRIEAVADESGRECRMVASDITTEIMAEKVLQERDPSLRTRLEDLPRA